MEDGVSLTSPTVGRGIHQADTGNPENHNEQELRAEYQARLCSKLLSRKRPVAPTRRPGVYDDVFESYAQARNRREFLDNIVTMLRHMTDCRCLGIRLVTPAGDIPYECFTGFSEEFWRKENCLNLGRDHCVCLRVISGQPAASDKKAMTPAGSFYCPNSTDFISGLTPQDLNSYRGVCVESGFLSIAVIPIQHQGRTVGAIHLADETPSILSADQLTTIESLAAIIGELVSRFNEFKELEASNQRLEQRISELAHVGNEFSRGYQRERTRLAQRMNEHVQQLMVCALFAIDAAARTIPQGKGSDLLAEADRVLREALAESRGLTSDLCPPVLYEFGLAETLHWLAGEAQREHGKTVEIVVEEGGEPQDLPVRLMLFDVLRQVLHSTASKEGADKIRLKLEPAPDEHIRLEVSAEVPQDSEGENSDVGRRLNIDACLTLIGATTKLTRRKNRTARVIFAPKKLDK